MDRFRDRLDRLRELTSPIMLSVMSLSCLKIEDMVIVTKSSVVGCELIKGCKSDKRHFSSFGQK